MSVIFVAYLKPQQALTCFTLFFHKKRRGCGQILVMLYDGQLFKSKFTRVGIPTQHGIKVNPTIKRYWQIPQKEECSVCIAFAVGLSPHPSTHKHTHTHKPLQLTDGLYDWALTSQRYKTSPSVLIDSWSNTSVLHTISCLVNIPSSFSQTYEAVYERVIN